MENCFRTFNAMDITFSVNHWTAQKIRVRMFISMMIYLFLAMIYNEIREKNESVAIISIGR